jgi:hypothetical protein
MRAMGNKPENFYGDRAKANTFIEDVKAYCYVSAYLEFLDLFYGLIDSQPFVTVTMTVTHNCDLWL